MTVSSALPLLADGVTLCELGVDNLRALRMEQPVELRRLTLLAGRNGIGKSTFARVFPLLRQSAGRRKREPLLWWERDEVDFGGFDEALRRGAEEISFTFRFRDADGTQWTALTVLGHGPDGSQVRRVELEQGDRQLSLRFGPDGRFQSVQGRMDGDLLNGTSHPWILGLQAVPGNLFAVGAFPEELASDRAALRRAESMFEEWRGGDWARVRLHDAEDLVDEIATRTAYVGPFRASPERTYRPQSVAVDQLDPRGANLAMFLAALSVDERNDLNAELRDKFGFAVTIESAGGHYSLQVEQDRGSFNLMDVGYGYSQLLPVAVQLWASSRKLSTSREQAPHVAIVIEQPELHLHPHQQVLMGHALGAFAADEHGPMQIIETHSDHLIGEIGMMIARGELPPERVGVVCFEPHPEGGTRVFNAHFNEHGVLHDWPVGFLSP